VLGRTEDTVLECNGEEGIGGMGEAWWSGATEAASRKRVRSATLNCIAAALARSLRSFFASCSTVKFFEGAFFFECGLESWEADGGAEEEDVAESLAMSAASSAVARFFSNPPASAGDMERRRRA
jgi:hypothetical protein